MKNMTRFLSILLIAILFMSMVPAGILAEASPNLDNLSSYIFNEEIGDEKLEPSDRGNAAIDSEKGLNSIGEDETLSTPAETAAPTASPDPASDNVPEIVPPSEEGPSMDEAYGDGITMGPNDPAEDAPTLFSTVSGTAAISVHNCFTSNGTQIKYVGSFNWNGHSVGGNGYPRYQITANGSPAYCVEPGGYLPGGSTVSQSAAHVWAGFSSAKREAIKVALLCGAEGNSSNLSGNFGSQYTATQMVIWEIIVGARGTSSPYTCTDSKVINSVCSGGANGEVKTVYDQISNAMRTYSELPSFVSPLSSGSPSYEMTYQDGNFTITLTDSNHVLSNYSFSSSNDSLRFSVSGDQLTVTSPSAVSSATVNVTKKNAASVSSTITAYAGSGLQETIVGIEATDNTSGWFSVYAEAEAPPAPSKTTLTIRKTAEDGNVSYISFTIDGMSGEAAGTHYTVYTDRYGTVTQELDPGRYLITERVPSGYTASPGSQLVTLQSGDAKTISFYNSVEKSSLLNIIKTSDDGKVSGIQFRITGGGTDQLVTTDSSGRVTVDGLSPGSYTVYEQVPEGYYTDRVSQSVTVREGETATVTFNNILKKWRVSVTKVDADGITRNSDVSLEGAVYGVFKGGQLQDRYTTDSQGHFTTEYYPCGDDWTLRELESPAGYTVDPTEYPIGAEPDEFNQAVKDTALTVKEQIIKGKLLIVKQDALTQTPLAGAVFTVYDETGASVTEGTTGEDGTFTVDELPYGKYTAKETTPPDGYQLDETVFDFAIETDGQIVTLTRDNIYCVGSITVHKVDTQGNALAGTTYLLEWSEDGSTWAPVVFREDTTPTIGGCTSLGLKSGQLTTGEDGSVLFDGLVANGKVYYRLTETKTQPGLSLLKDPVFQGTLPLEGETDKEYDISYTVTNDRITTLPQTGGSGLLLPVTIGTALLGLAGCTGFFVARSKKAKSGKEN